MLSGATRTTEMRLLNRRLVSIDLPLRRQRVYLSVQCSRHPTIKMRTTHRRRSGRSRGSSPSRWLVMTSIFKRRARPPAVEWRGEQTARLSCRRFESRSNGHGRNARVPIVARALSVISLAFDCQAYSSSIIQRKTELDEIRCYSFWQINDPSLLYNYCGRNAVVFLSRIQNCYSLFNLLIQANVFWLLCNVYLRNSCSSFVVTL